MICHKCKELHTPEQINPMEPPQETCLLCQFFEGNDINEANKPLWEAVRPLIGELRHHNQRLECEIDFQRLQNESIQANTEKALAPFAELFRQIQFTSKASPTK